MSKKTPALQIVEKAWVWAGRDNPDYNPEICYGITLNKAKAALYNTLHDLGWILEFKELITDFSFRRAPSSDRVKMPPAPALEQLTEKQRHIIGHANGNNGREPGYRDYYCTTDGDPDCEHLVTLGLMKHGRTLNSHASSRYYLLTEDGALAALSDAVIERRRAEQIVPWIPHLANEKGMLHLESIEANPDILALIPADAPCRIYSSQWGYYWRPKSSGYGTKDEAGIYTFKDAYGRTRHCGSEKGIWYDFVVESTQESAA